MIGRIFFPFLLLILALAYGSAAQYFPVMGLQEGFGPGFFPTIVTSVVGFFALVEGIRQVAEYRRTRGGADWGVRLREVSNSLTLVASVVVTVIAMPHVGFIAASAALVFVLSIVMGTRPLWKSISLSLFLAVGLYLVFSEGFGVVFAF